MEPKSNTDDIFPLGEVTNKHKESINGPVINRNFKRVRFTSENSENINPNHDSRFELDTKREKIVKFLLSRLIEYKTLNKDSNENASSSVTSLTLSSNKISPCRNIFKATRNATPGIKKWFLDLGQEKRANHLEKAVSH